MITYADATPADAAPLVGVAARSFTETFGHLYSPDDLALYLGGLPASLANPALAVRVARECEAIIGFATVGPVTSPGTDPASAIELHKFYVLREHHGMGVAPVLMDWVLATARANRAKAIVLSVFYDNFRARRFYKRYGFVEVGRHVYMVGNQADDDLVYRLTL